PMTTLLLDVRPVCPDPALPWLILINPAVRPGQAERHTGRRAPAPTDEFHAPPVLSVTDPAAGNRPCLGGERTRARQRPGVRGPRWQRPAGRGGTGPCRRETVERRSHRAQRPGRPLRARPVARPDRVPDQAAGPCAARRRGRPAALLASPPAAGLARAALRR